MQNKPLTTTLLANKSPLIIMRFSVACVSSLIAPIITTTRLSITNDENKHKLQSLAAASYSKVKTTIIYKKLADRLEISDEPNKIHNIEDVKDKKKKDEGTASSTPTTDTTGSDSDDKEECGLPVTASKTSRLDAAGNLSHYHHAPP
jgi:hypothetical protein